MEVDFYFAPQQNFDGILFNYNELLLIRNLELKF